MRKGNKAKASRQSEGKRYVKQCLAVVVLTVVLYAVLVAIAAFIVTKINTPHNLFGTISAVCLGIAQFFSAFFMLKRFKENGLITGAASGAFLCLCCAAVSAATNGTVGLNAPVTLVIGVCSGALGGALGVNSSHKRRKK